MARFPSRQPSPRAARPPKSPSGGELQRRRSSSRRASLDHTAAGPAPAVIQTNIYDKRLGSTDITTHLDHTSQCKPMSGSAWSNRWTNRVFIMNTQEGGCANEHRTSIHDKRSDSTKITTHLDHISHCKPTSGPNWSNRWTKLGPIDGRTEEGCRLAARVWITRPQVSHLQSNTSVSFSSGWHRISCSISITVIENHLNLQQDSILGL